MNFFVEIAPFRVSLTPEEREAARSGPFVGFIVHSNTSLDAHVIESEPCFFRISTRPSNLIHHTNRTDCPEATLDVHLALTTRSPIQRWRTEAAIDEKKSLCPTCFPEMRVTRLAGEVMVKRPRPSSSS